MSFVPEKLLLVFLGSLLIGVPTVIFTRFALSKVLIVGLLLGVFFYSGLGACDQEVGSDFLIYYIGTFAAIAFGFLSGRTLFNTLGLAVASNFHVGFRALDKKKVWVFVLVAYIGCHIFPLLWPELRIELVVMPPSPNLAEYFSRVHSEQKDVVTQLNGYIVVLLTPFVFIALNRLRVAPALMAGFFLVILYFQYIASAYIGRGEVLLALGFVILATWQIRPTYRRRMLLVGALLFPFFLYVLYWYQQIRIGGDAYSEGVGSVLVELSKGELGFPRDVGVPIIEQGLRTDFTKYLIWIFTLPIPKVITGAIEGARINYEISEAVLGVPYAQEGWYIVLPGLVAESVYIFGTEFFWVHGIFLGLVAAFLSRLLERSQALSFVYLQVVILFSYVLNRAGVGGLLPVIVNGFLAFYIFVAVCILISISKKYVNRRMAQ